MTTETFKLEAQDRARVSHAVTTCARELGELAAGGLHLDGEQTDELRVLLATVAPARSTSRQSLRRAAAAGALE